MARELQRRRDAASSVHFEECGTSHFPGLESSVAPDGESSQVSQLQGSDEPDLMAAALDDLGVALSHAAKPSSEA